MAALPVAFEFWRHRGTGQIWAVRISGMHVTGAAGPLTLRDVTYGTLEEASYQEEPALWIERSREEFALQPIVAGPDS